MHSLWCSHFLPALQNLFQQTAWVTRPPPFFRQKPESQSCCPMQFSPMRSRSGIVKEVLVSQDLERGAKKNRFWTIFTRENLVDPMVNPMVNPQPRAKVGILNLVWCLKPEMLVKWQLPCGPNQSSLQYGLINQCGHQQKVKLGSHRGLPAWHLSVYQTFQVNIWKYSNIMC